MTEDIFKTESKEVEPYAQEYDLFQQTFKKTEVSGEEVGELVMRMAHYYMTYNVRMVQALKRFSEVKAAYLNGTDPATLKPMTSSKAEALADATQEAFAYEQARVHLQNIEQGINALKSLQRGVLFEYANS
mgnify:CR=1 FL=1